MSINSSFTPTISVQQASFNGLAIALSMLFALPGLVVHLVVIVAVVKHYKSLNSSFYLILLSLSTIDVAYLLETLLYTVPCIALQSLLYTNAFDVLIGNLDTFIWFAQISHQLYIAINRLLIVRSTSLTAANRFFSPPKIAIALTVIYAFSAFMSALMNLTTCTKPYNFQDYYFGFTCADAAVSAVGMMVNEVISNFFPFSAALFYVVTWIEVRRRRAKVTAQMADNELGRRRRRQEISIAVQFTVICAATVLNVLAFWIVPPSLPDRRGSLMLAIIATVNASVNAYVYLAVNADVREKVQLLLCGGTAHASRVVTTSWAVAVKNRQTQPRA